MDNLQIFNSEEFGEIRAVVINGEGYLIAKDVAEKLGYSNPRKAIIDHVDEEDKGVTKCDTLGGKQELTIINESGLYSLVLSSKLPEAKKFKRWVTSEVLPSIRKNGGYIAGQEQLSDSELMAKALMVAQSTIERRNAEIAELKNDVIVKDKMIEEQKPAVIFSEAVAGSKNSILVGELAKIICQNGYEIGQNRLFKWLRGNAYLMKDNTPYQRYVEQGLFEIKESSVLNPDGSIRVTRTTKVTGKGQVYFVNKFMRKE